MELFRKPQASGRSWPALLLIFVNLLTLVSMEAPRRPRNPEPDKPINIDQRAEYSKPRVYFADFDSAINHILRVQLVKVPIFKGQKLHALHNLLALLHYYNPLTTEIGKHYVNNIYWSIKSQTVVSKDSLAMTVNDTELADKSFRSEEYFGCRGAEAGLRGFNCAVWVLFHYLTVRAAESPITFEPGAVLWTLLGYTNFFMGCPECHQLLWFYVQDRPIENVKTHDDEILWLWRAHNDLNFRLADDGHAAMYHPKVQFPPRNYCPRCRSLKGGWDTKEVLNYLKTIYNIDNFNTFGLDSKLGR